MRFSVVLLKCLHFIICYNHILIDQLLATRNNSTIIKVKNEQINHKLFTWTTVWRKATPYNIGFHWGIEQMSSWSCETPAYVRFKPALTPCGGSLVNLMAVCKGNRIGKIIVLQATVVSSNTWKLEES